MKFRLFGGLDCPDSVLAQLSVVSTLPPAIVAKLVDHCTNVILFSADATVGSASSSSSTANSEGLMGSSSNSRWSDIARETSNLHQSIAADIHNASAGSEATSGQAATSMSSALRFAQALTAIHTLVTNMTRYDVSADAATEDLTMLGLDPAVAEVVVSGTHGVFSQLRTALQRQLPMHHAIRGMDAALIERSAGTFTDEGKFVESTADDAGTLPPLVRTRWLVDGSRHADGAAAVTIDISLEKARALLVELTMARDILEKHNNTTV